MLIFFSEVSALEILLKENPAVLHTAHDKVAAFRRKVQLFKKKRLGRSHDFLSSDDDYH